MKTKPRLSFWQIWNMSFGFLGIQFGFALQNANVSRIFETLGAKIDDIPILWIAAPITGLLIQPIIGYMSDHTWGKLGRRRPYFLAGAILASLALLIMPNSPALWVAAGMLWIMDASINISMEPFRAFVGDKLPSEQRTCGFAMQSFFIGTGAIIASALPYMLTNWFGVSNTAPAGQIPMSVKLSFYLGAIAFIGAVVWTVVRSKEYSPNQLKEFNKNHQEAESGGLKQIFTDFRKMPKTMIQLAFVQFFSWFALFAMWIYTTNAVTHHIYNMKSDEYSINYLFNKVSKEKNDTSYRITNEISTLQKNKKSILQLETIDYFISRFSKDIFQSINIEFPSYFKSPININKTNEILQLINNSNNWYNEYNIIRKFQYIKKEFNDGADWVGICFAAYSGFAAIVAFLLPVLAKYTSRKITHMICLLIGGISLASIYLVHTPEFLILPFVGIGVAWASILSMPYAILTGSLPSNKMGIYMGIFNFFIVIPQILAASILGFFTKTLFGGEAIYTLILGGVSMVIAALLVLIVKDDDDRKL